MKKKKDKEQRFDEAIFGIACIVWFFTILVVLSSWAL